METKQSVVGSLKVGNYVLIDDVACVIRDIKISKGRHGHAKSRIEATSLIDGTKKIIVKPNHDRITVPIIEKKTAQVLSIQGNVANVMDMETYETFDLKIPENLKNEVAEGKQVSYWIILGSKVMKQVK